MHFLASAVTLTLQTHSEEKRARVRQIGLRNIFRYTAKQGAFTSLAAMAAHDNQVDLFILHCLDNLMARVAHCHFSLEVGATLEVLITDTVH